MFRRTLRSRWVWRLTGVSYPSAVYATNGRLLTPMDYLSFCRAQMRSLDEFLPEGGRVLEFGSGLGGNLIALGHRIQHGVGLDVNRGFVDQASRLALAVGASNIEFLIYDGTHLPLFDKPFDLIFSIGVFERLPQDLVGRYLAELVARLSPGGRLICYFLTERARATTFTGRLGAEAYTYWTVHDVEAATRHLPLRRERVLPWGPYPARDGAVEIPVGDVYVFSKTSVTLEERTG